jgi:hypothetical protein
MAWGNSLVEETISAGGANVVFLNDSQQDDEDAA